MICCVCGSQIKFSNFGRSMQCENVSECGFAIRDDVARVYYRVGNFEQTYSKDISDEERHSIQDAFVAERDRLAMKLNKQHYYARH